jgi:hypothetical protein
MASETLAGWLAGWRDDGSMPAAGRDRTRSIAAAVTHNPIKSICPADVEVRVHGRHAHCAGAGGPSARRDDRHAAKRDRSELLPSSGPFQTPTGGGGGGALVNYKVLYMTATRGQGLLCGSSELVPTGDPLRPNHNQATGSVLHARHAYACVARR